MSNPANVLIREHDLDSGVYIYTHWDAHNLPKLLKKALNKKWRWNDCQYLTRIIYDTVVQGSELQEAGYGLSSSCGDGSNKVIKVVVENQIISFRNKEYSFDEFCLLSETELNNFWINSQSEEE